MELSNFFLRLTGLAIDTLMNTTRANIRWHDAENIPDQPVVYVVNHFTRMETFFLPHLIYKITGKHALSLAYHEFFGGGFGRYLSKLGAISTKAENRDTLMTSALLRGDFPCIIFPEGQMVKDKKIVEKGKFMVYNSGIRRPPHTGAALLALRSEFVRRHMRRLAETGNAAGVSAYRAHFEIPASFRTDEITARATVIVPVNITYFPVRSRKNLLNTIAGKIAGAVPSRVDEELEVEGAMILDGVDIDINFGAPIGLDEYFGDPAIVRALESAEPVIGRDETARRLPFARASTALMARYMSEIYALTTVNHDHIFSYLLTAYWRKRIRIEDFRMRAFYAANLLYGYRSTIRSFHSTLMRDQSHLLSDDTFHKLDNFLTAVAADGLIRLKNGFIIRNRARFRLQHEFHSVRKDNIVEVMRNEIEPIVDAQRCVRRASWLPGFLLRRRIRDQFVALDRDIFERDYRHFFREGESKPREVGAPFFLRRFFSRTGVLLVHGYMAAPEEVRPLADYLRTKGYAVYGVRLRGHGTTPDDLAQRTWVDWYESVNRGYIIMKNTVRRMAIVGFSTGAGLALLHAANKPHTVRCAVSINAPLKLANPASRFAFLFAFLNRLLARFKIPRALLPFVPNNPENPDINYARNPVAGVDQLEELMGIVNDRLRDITMPVLVVQGSDDPVVKAESGKKIYKKIKARKKELYVVPANHHGILRGDEAPELFVRVHRFLRRHL
ncbi:MAG TPA: alpha/beta fold hydrolase [Spirochaetota bacterium]|nr:alpha/beta fold hydrolase [Spirochaetota bacterium]HOS39887.1 alpha/beta fold hydrolase [Spirochaetota bacterium]HPU87144.1 alpha/beta fold hydrolase [Spirochaetota bacterium]